MRSGETAAERRLFVHPPGGLIHLSVPPPHCQSACGAIGPVQDKERGDDVRDQKLTL